MKIPTDKEELKEATKKELKKKINSMAEIIFWSSVLLMYLGIWIDGYHSKLIATSILTFIVSVLISYIADKVTK